MMVKVAFSFVTWLSNLIFLVIVTHQITPSVPKKQVQFSIIFTKIYICVVFLSQLAIIVFALYFWYLIGLKPQKVDDLAGLKMPVNIDVRALK